MSVSKTHPYTHPGIVAIYGDSSLESASTHLLAPLYYLLDQALPGTIATYEITRIGDETVISIPCKQSDGILLCITKVFLSVIGALLLTLPGLLLRTIAQKSETSKTLHTHITQAKKAAEEFITTHNENDPLTWQTLARRMTNGFLIEKSFRRRFSRVEIRRAILSFTSRPKGIEEIMHCFHFFSSQQSFPIELFQRIIQKLNSDQKKELVARMENAQLGIPLKNFCIDGKNYPNFHTYYLEVCDPAFTFPTRSS